jgi:hypothetical protein
MAHNRDMRHLEAAVAISLCDEAFDDLRAALHQCTSWCADPCLIWKSVWAIVTVTIDVCAETAGKLRRPGPISAPHLTAMVWEIAEEVWEFYDLTNNPIEFNGTYTVRNKTIRTAMVIKSRAAYRRLPNFSGFK